MGRGTGWIRFAMAGGLALAVMTALPTAGDFAVATNASADVPSIAHSPTVWEPSAVKSLQGKRCKKRGVTRTVGSETYRCRGKKGRLRWRLMPPSPSPTPSPTPVISDGSACTTVGERVDNEAGYLECRHIADGRSVFRQLSIAPSAPPIAASPEPLETCRLADTRPLRGRPAGPGGPLITEAIAYPVTSAARRLPLPATGTARVAVLPYDFLDVPGEVDPGSWLAPQLERVSEWIDYHSNGSVSYDFVTSDSWIRASKPSTEYQWIHPFRDGVMPPDLSPGPFKTAQWITEDLLRSAPAHLDLTGVHAVVFVYPPTVQAIYDMVVRDMNVQSPRNLGHILVFTTGRWLYEEDRPLWSYMVHEFGHFHGIPGHAPWDGNPLDVMTNQHGMSITLNTWSRLTMDWQDTAEIYCVRADQDAADPGQHEVTLSAIDTQEPGTKAVMVRLSESRALIIESRRRSTWSSDHFGWQGLPRGFYGVTVMRVDTSIDVNRVQRSGAYLDYVAAPELRHGILRVPFMSDVDLNWVLYEGEAMTVDGVRIELVRSGDADTVRVARS